MLRALSLPFTLTRAPTDQDRLDVLPICGTGITIVRDGRALLDDVSVTFGPRGGIVVVLGPNGAGKSLLIRTLAGLVAPDQGEVLWAGRSPDRLRVHGVGFVFQRPVMLRRSALANVVYALRASGVPSGAAPAQAMAALESVGLGHLAHAPARYLSGGEQQRVALARALALHPDVLFLDEPTSNLDPASTAAIEQRLREVAVAGTRVVLVTQDLAQARRVASHVVLLHRGRVVEEAEAQTFFESPATAVGQSFVRGEIVL